MDLPNVFSSWPGENYGRTTMLHKCYFQIILSIVCHNTVNPPMTITQTSTLLSNSVVKCGLISFCVRNDGDFVLFCRYLPFYYILTSASQIFAINLSQLQGTNGQLSHSIDYHWYQLTVHLFESVIGYAIQRHPLCNIEVNSSKAIHCLFLQVHCSYNMVPCCHL